MHVEMEVIISVILLVIGIGLLVFIHVCVVRAFRGNPDNGSDHVSSRVERIRSMKREDIEELPSFVYKAEEQEKTNAECAVCLENFKDGEKCRVLPKCDHSFHVECIDSWLLKTAACTICRAAAKLLKVEECTSFSGEGV